jgi:transcription antitermination factor NusG
MVSAAADEKERVSEWCVLRTSGRSTMRLAQSLAEDGFETWTPIETRRIRIPRANVRRDIRLPLMPSYVFARSHHLVDLIQMANMPFKPRRSHGKPAHPDFSIMHHHETIPLIADDQLQALRQLEAKRTPRKRAAQTFARGVEVRIKIEGGSFAGMKGVVQRSDHGHSLVFIDNRMTVKIPTSLLFEDDIKTQSALIEPAASKAA